MSAFWPRLDWTTNLADCSKVFKDVKIKLEMNALEAAVLYAIMQRIGGAPDTTLRGVTSNINAALERVLAPNLWDSNYNLNASSPFYPIYESMTGEGLDFEKCIKTRDQLESDLQFHLANN